MQAPDAAAQPGFFRRGSSNSRLIWWLRVLLLIVVATVVVVTAWNAIGAIAHIIFVVLASLLFAYLIGPIVDRWSHHMRRGAAIGLVFLIVLPLAALLLFLFIAPIVSELRQVAIAISGPGARQSEVISQISAFLTANGISIDVGNLVSQLSGLIKSTSDMILNLIIGAAGNVAGFVTDVLLGLALTFFLAVDGRGLNVRILRLMPDTFREHVMFVEAIISRVIGGYIRAQIIVASLYALLAGGGSWVLGVPHALFIGIAAFFLEFVPLIGPVISMFIAIIFSLFDPFPMLVFVTIYFIIIQQVESNVLEPRISGRILGLHAVVVIVGVVVGAALGGIIGAFLALPIIAAITTLGAALYLDIRGRTNLLISLHPGQAAGDGPDTPDIMEGAPPAALMLKDRLDYILKEQARLRATYEEVSARQSAAERRSHGLT
ncbi:MAG: AI-2E family transporter [Chloroflexia bacterium]